MRLLGVLLLWALTGALHPADVSKSAVHRLPFLCPRAEGVCFWSLGAGWQKVVASSPDSIVEFQQGSDGRLTVLLRGHGNPGNTIVAAPDGTIQAIRQNAIEGNLQRVAGVDVAGNVVLCSDTPEEARCDVFLPSRNVTATSPWFPDGCLFPRFLSDGSRACLQYSPDPALLLVRGDNQVQKISLPGELASPDDFHALSTTIFVFRVLNALFVFEPGAEPREIAKDGVLWSVVSEGDVLFGVYREGEKGRHCSLQRYRPGQETVELWRSDVLVPAMAHRVNGVVLLDAWGGGTRQLIRLPQRKGHSGEILWTEHSGTLWQ